MSYRTAIACLVLACASSANAAFVVVPPSSTTTLGGFQSPAPLRRGGTGGAHNQQVDLASLFKGVTGAIKITSLSLRPTSSFFAPSISVSDIRVSLSTTQRGDETSARQLSATFSDNIGPDNTLVYSGPLTITTNSTGSLTGNPQRDFDYTITFQTPFTYDPARGNLLLDFLIPDSATVQSTGFFNTVAFDDVNNFNDGVYSVTNINSGSALTGAPATDGNPILYNFTPASVPEPTALTLLTLPAALVLRRRA
jgi:hypothetical protein